MELSLPPCCRGLLCRTIYVLIGLAIHEFIRWQKGQKVHRQCGPGERIGLCRYRARTSVPKILNLVAFELRRGQEVRGECLINC
jgi:hypothetical protein